jgi:hypothetical protein
MLPNHHCEGLCLSLGMSSRGSWIRRLNREWVGQGKEKKNVIGVLPGGCFGVGGEPSLPPVKYVTEHLNWAILYF